MILLTGATGFIGRHVLAGLLKKQYKVLVVVRNRNQYVPIGNEVIVEGDLNHLSDIENALQQYSFETLIHLAWEGIPDYSFSISSRNLIYGMNVLKLCKLLSIKQLVLTGSCWEYQNPNGCISEQHALSSQNSFKAAKNSLRLMCDAFCSENDIQYHWLRLFYVYGAGQKKTSLIPYIISELKEGRQPALKGAFNKNDFIYVTDAADAIIQAVKEKPAAKVMNVGNGKAVEILDILKMVSSFFDFEIDFNAFREPKEKVCFWANMDATQKNLRWSPQIPIEKGIELTVNSLISK